MNLSAIPAKPRQFEQLETGPFDVLIIGGGITGAGLARDLALRGARVALVERDDFASGTSSRSTKLIHGGLRYLEQMAFGLVFEACRERHLLQRLAPHLVQPLPLLIPLYRGARRGPATVRAGLLLYDLLALFRNTHPHRMLGRAAALERQPRLDPEGLLGAALYWDCRMDDARLCLENLIAASEAGAVTLNHAPAVALLKHRGRIAGAAVCDGETGRTVEVAARVVVNASGPWLDRVCALAGQPAGKLRPSRGTHLLVPRLTRGAEALYLSAGRDDRLFFVIPWGELSLIGTTDLDEPAAPETVRPSAAEVDYLLAATAEHLPGTRLAPADVVASFTGVRPLLAAAGGQPSRASREHRIFEATDGLISVGGGKYTTYRSMAAEVADRVMARLGRPAGTTLTDRLALPGAPDQPVDAFAVRLVAAAAGRQGLDPAWLHTLCARYGGRTPHLLALLEREPALAAPVCPDSPLTALEVAYAADFELARTPADVLRRRTPLALQQGRGQHELAAVSALLAARLGHPAALAKRQLAAYHEQID